MSFSRLLKKYSQARITRPAPTDRDAGPNHSVEDSTGSPQRRQPSVPTPSMPRPWGRKKSSTADHHHHYDHAGSSQPQPMLPSTGHERPTTEGTEGAVNGMSMSPLIPLPATSSVFLTNMAIPPQSEMMPAISPVTDTLAEAWDIVKDGPQVSSMNRALNAVDDVAATTQDNAAPLIPIIKATVTAVQQTDMGKAIKDEINKFSESMPIFLNALDELKSLHPFIGVVVLAFKTVYTLEQKRRDNDKKIASLYVGMKDTMGVLFLLRRVENEDAIAPDGISIVDRLKSLVELTAEDIKTCSNVCDAYMKKRPLSKVLLSAVWDAKLLSFVDLFAERRKAFQFEISIHTSQGVDKANAKLDALGDATRALDDKINVLKDIFQQLISPEQKQLSEIVAAKGGINILRHNDKALLDLERNTSKGSGPPSLEGYRTRQGKSRDTVTDKDADNLRNDIFEDPNVAVEKNWTVFSRKFEAQKNQIIDELTTVVQRESDRVVRELTSGAHERIRDRSIHEIWVEMGWRGNVKARHLVLALRDYYMEKLISETKGALGASNAITTSSHPDAWAIEFMDIMWIQPILEAIDDDASGFITITEVNTFTGSRPDDWSLPHWLAFWAAGFKWSTIDYAQQIEELFAKMEGARTIVLPSNRDAADFYFKAAWETIHTLTAAVLSLYPESNESEKFNSYVEAEEARLGHNLRAVNYVIDGIDTLTLIAGVGRIEKTVFPLYYLLMKRHYEIFRIMRIKVVNFRDLWEGVQSIGCVEEAIAYRVHGLINNFSQQRLDPEKQFQHFAHGMFKYFHNRTALWSPEYIRNLRSQTIPYSDEQEDQNVQLAHISNYPYKDEISLDDWVYDRHSTEDISDHRDIESPLKDVLGHWNGYLYNDQGAHVEDDSMMTIILMPAEGELDIKGNGWSFKRRRKISGSWSKDENDVIQIKFRMSFLDESWNDIFCNCSFDARRDALTGGWGASAELESFDGKMELRRILPRHLTSYPSMKELSDNKPRALWKFAIAAIRNDIRRDSWSWSYFSRRRDDREEAISLLVRCYYFGPPLNIQEDQRLYEIAKRLTPVDACFYQSKATYIRAHTWIHRNAWCDSCLGRIGGPRLTCLDCVNKNMEIYNPLDLCCAPQCVAARVTHRQDLESPHEPNHRLLKVRITVVKRNHGHAYAAACEAFERVGEICMKVAEFSSQSHQEKENEPEQKISCFEPTTSTELHSEKDTLARGDVVTTPDHTKLEGDAEAEHNASQDGIQARDRDQNLPRCGSCKNHLSFPFWYCIFCPDDLFICDGCDEAGVPDLERGVGRHTEEHHLIRCLAPEDTVYEVPPTEQRLTAIEGRLDGMQTQLDGLVGHMGELTGQIGDLHARMGNIEQLLHKLAGALGSAA